MEVFCNEIVQSRHKHCKSKQNDAQKFQDNGPEYALRLILPSSKVISEQYPWEVKSYSRKTSWDLQSLSIHHPKSIPFMTTDAITPSPGLFTKVVITPRVTTTDKTLSQAEFHKKKCFSIQYDQNPLKLFNHYSQENCLFECHYWYAKERHGCVHCDFPIGRRDGG